MLLYRVATIAGRRTNVDMADGIVPRLLAPAAFAFDASVSLNNKIKSFSTPS
jgi:hypothetical protein